MDLPNFNLVFALLINTLFAAMPVGYELIVLNDPQSLLESFVNSSFEKEHGYSLNQFSLSILWSFIVACQAIGAVFGCFLVVPMLNILGRKFCLMILNNILVIIGSLLMGLSETFGSFEFLITGRLVLGLSTGAVMTTLPIWISEIAPANLRGTFSCLQHTFLTLGSAAGAFLGLEGALGNPHSWGYLLALPGFIAAMQIVLFPLFPETATFLLINRKNEEAAYESIRYYYGPDINCTAIAVEIENEARGSVAQKGLCYALKNPVPRSRLLLGALSNFAQIFTGLMAVVSYSTVILTAIGLPETSSQVVTAVGALVFALISLPAIYLVEKLGRRVLLLTTLALVAVSNFGFFAFNLVLEKTAATKGSNNWAMVSFVACIFLFAVSYNLGPGPIVYFLSAELAPPATRTVSLAVGVAVNWVSTILSVLVFYPLQNATGSFSFLLFAIPTLVSFCVLYWKLPETKTVVCPGRGGYEPLVEEHGEDDHLEQGSSVTASERSSLSSHYSHNSGYGMFGTRNGSTEPI